MFANVLILEPLSADTPQRIFLLFVVTLLPYSVVAPFVGVFVDRWARRSLLVVTNAFRGVLLISLPLWSNAFPGDLGLLLGVLVMLAFGRLFLTTKGAALPTLLREKRLLTGNALSSGGGMVSALVGGALGVVGVGIARENAAFMAAGVIYAGSAALASRISSPLVPEGRTPRLGEAVAQVARELVEGLRAVWARPRARLPLTGIFLMRTIGMFVAVAAIIVIKNEFPDAGDRFGRLSSSALALGAAGVGAFVAALIAPAIGRRVQKPGLIVTGFMVSGVGIIALGGVVAIPAVLALTFTGGLGTFLSKVAVDAQVQEAIPDALRGRVFALYDVLYNLASVAAGGLMVILQDAPFRLSLISVGIAAVVVAIGLRSAMRRAGMFATAG